MSLNYYLICLQLMDEKIKICVYIQFFILYLYILLFITE